MPEPPKYAELEIGFHRVRPDAHQVELRFTNPGSESELLPARGDVRFDFATLLAQQFDPKAYGKALGSMLFADESIRSMYRQAQAAAESLNLTLRVRLLVGPTAADLHDLRWELLAGPDTGEYLFTSERVPFSRLATAQDWRTIKLRPKAEMKALIAVSAPSNLARYQLAPVDIDGEIKRATASLAGVEVAVAGKDGPLTLAHLVQRLGGDPVDILYLVAHGMYTSDGPYVFLQEEDGTVARVKGTDLAARLNDLSQQPRLVVLASCESSGSEAGDDAGADALHSLAPLLAEAGVPAILAMRGKISMKTVEQVLPVFFRELLEDGQIDRAMAAARSTAVALGRPDFWMPAPYLRLRGGRIWYEPGFTQGGDFEKWRSIATHVRDGKAVAILGSGVCESIYGDSRNMARELAKANHFPLAEHHQDDLPRVLQYLTVDQDSAYASKAVLVQIGEEVLKRHGGRIPSELHGAPLAQILDFIIQTPAEGRPENAYQVLAGLPVSVYIPATPDRLLTRALKAAGKNPQVLIPNWRRTGTEMPVEPPYNGTPTPGAPVVYQMLGVYNKDESVVLTEDDYFDYVIATASYKLVPRVVRSALVSNSLLFLGFQLTDWSFRVLFRLIQSLEGGAKNARMAHVGVQLDPEEYTFADARKARSYLQKYFDKEANIALFWGSAEDFLHELQKQIANFPEQARAAAASAGGDWDV
jgi:hypothetical protein